MLFVDSLLAEFYLNWIDAESLICKELTEGTPEREYDLEISDQYLDTLWRYLLDTPGDELISLTPIFKKYGKPRKLTPQKFIDIPIVKDKIQNMCELEDYEIEKIIQFGDLKVDNAIGFYYLNMLDPENYRKSKHLIKIVMYWDNIPERYEALFMCDERFGNVDEIMPPINVNSLKVESSKWDYFEDED